MAKACCDMRAVDIVGFDKGAVPGWIARSGGENAGRVVLRSRIASAGDDVAVAGTEPGTVRAMLGEDLEIEVLAQVEEALKAYSAERFVAEAGAWDRDAPAGQVSGGSDAVHGVSADALHTELACAECLTAREERGVGILSVGQVDVAIGGTEYGCR